MRLPITLVDPTLPVPAYHSEGAVAFDLYARVEMVCPPFEPVRIPANVIVQVPDGCELRVSLRSSTPIKKRLMFPHGVGIVDRDYCGPNDEIQVLVVNFSQEPVTVARGERFAQAAINRIEHCEIAIVEPAKAADRGGFGSTG
jgi:dUTP pyrophosphatase